LNNFRISKISKLIRNKRRVFKLIPDNIDLNQGFRPFIDEPETLISEAASEETDSVI
jgi:hypothetical protein